MTTILLCRHGETTHNRDGTLQGVTDAPLNDRGREQAAMLADRLADEPLAAVYCSTLERARDTAAAVADRHDLEPQPMQDLREIDLGAMEGADVERWYEHVDAHGNRLRHAAPDDGESLMDVEHRVISALTTIAGTHPDDTVAVIAHGAANRAAIMGILDIPAGNYPRISQGNTCVNTLTHDAADGWTVRTVNDTSHLYRNETK